MSFKVRRDPVCYSDCPEYGWGDGEWMRDWVERMTAAGATVVGGEGVICQDAPDDDAKTACEELGKKLAAV